MSEDSKHLIFYINSRTDQSKSTDNEADFTTILQTEWTDGYDKCYVSQLTVPRTEYQIRDGKNTFYIQTYYAFGGWTNVQAITVTTGNYYDPNDMVEELNLRLWVNPIFGPDPGPGNARKAYFSFDQRKGKIQFTVEANFADQNGPYRFYVPSPSNLDDVLGLYKNENAEFIANAGFIFPFIVNTIVSNVYSLCCDNIVSSTSQKTTNILTCINVGTVGVNQYFSQTFSKESGSVDITTKSQNWHFYLQNQDREIVDTNGIAIAFTLVLFVSKEKQELLKSHNPSLKK